MSEAISKTKLSEGGRTLHPEKSKLEQTRKSITIGQAPETVYAFWRNFDNLARFMKDLHEVEVLSPTRSRWKVILKSGMEVEWTAEITQESPGHLIAWRSEEGSPIQTTGEVRFTTAPAQLGTVVELFMDYHIPGGKLTEFAAVFTGEDPTNLVLTNLKRLKAYLETGEIPTNQGQPSGREKGAVTIKSRAQNLH